MTDNSDDFPYLLNFIETDKREACREKAIEKAVKGFRLAYPDKQCLCQVVGKNCKPSGIKNPNPCVECGTYKTQRNAM